MKELSFCAELPDGRKVCIAPVSRDTFEDNKAYSLGDDCGYFIYELDSRHPEAGIEILGKAASFDAAMRLVDIFMTARSAQLAA